jgi:hypothetical protein
MSFARFVAVLALSLTILQLAGCIGVSTFEGRTFDSFPPANLPESGAKAIAVNVIFSATGVPATKGIRTNVQQRVTAKAQGYLQKTGRAGMIGGAGGYTLTIQVRDDGGSGASLLTAFLTGLTLYVIPSWVTHNYTTDVSLTDTSGKMIGSRSFSHMFRMYQQLFLVFGMPVASPDGVADRIWDDVMQDVAVWTVETIASS